MAIFVCVKFLYATITVIELIPKKIKRFRAHAAHAPIKIGLVVKNFQSGKIFYLQNKPVYGIIRYIHTHTHQTLHSSGVFP